MELQSKQANNPPTYAQASAPQENQQCIVVVNNDQKCPACNQVNTMNYSDVVSTRQHLWFICLCLSSIACCCSWIPYVSNTCMFNQGKCRSCGYTTKDKTNNMGLIILTTVIAILTLISVILIIVFTASGYKVVNDHFNALRESNSNHFGDNRSRPQWTQGPQ